MQCDQRGLPRFLPLLAVLAWRGVAWQEEVYDVVPQSPDVAHLDQQRRLLQRVKESVFSDLLRQYAPPPALTHHPCLAVLS